MDVAALLLGYKGDFRRRQGAEGRRRWSVMLAFAVLFSVLSGESLGQSTSPAAIPAVERPTSLPGLLVNAKLAAEQWLLLREDFYREDVLQQYFGGAVIKFIDRQSSRLIRGTITGFDNIVERFPVQG